MLVPFNIINGTYFFFKIILFWHKWKEFIAKKNKNSKPLEQEERHHALKTLIDEAPSGPIITPPNKATYSNTNNIVPTPILIKLFKKFFFALGVFLINLIHLSKLPYHNQVGHPNNFEDFHNIPFFIGVKVWLGHPKGLSHFIFIGPLT